MSGRRGPGKQVYESTGVPVGSEEVGSESVPQPYAASYPPSNKYTAADPNASQSSMSDTTIENPDKQFKTDTSDWSVGGTEPDTYTSQILHTPSSVHTSHTDTSTSNISHTDTSHADTSHADTSHRDTSNKGILGKIADAAKSLVYPLPTSEARHAVKPDTEESQHSPDPLGTLGTTGSRATEESYGTAGTQGTQGTQPAVEEAPGSIRTSDLPQGGGFSNDPKLAEFRFPKSAPTSSHMTPPHTAFPSAPGTMQKTHPYMAQHTYTRVHDPNTETGDRTSYSIQRQFQDRPEAKQSDTTDTRTTPGHTPNSVPPGHRLD